MPEKIGFEDYNIQDRDKLPSIEQIKEAMTKIRIAEAALELVIKKLHNTSDKMLEVAKKVLDASRPEANAQEREEALNEIYWNTEAEKIDEYAEAREAEIIKAVTKALGEVLD